MKVTVQNKPEESTAELVISAEPVELKSFFDKAAKEISKEHPVKGFRPGKVPLKVVAEKLGAEHVVQHVLESAIPRLFVEAAVQENVEAINRPSISVTKASLDGPLEFTAIVDVLPQVTLGDPKKITAKKRLIEVKDEDVNRELQYLARSRSTYLDVARPAQLGDILTVDFDISHLGQTIEGGSSKQHPVPLGEGHFVPGFEEGIIGMSAGDERTFPLTMKDQTVEAKVKAHRVQQRIVPQFDDAFAKSLGKFDTLQHLKEKIKENLTAERIEKEHDRHVGEVAEAFAALATFTRIPDILIEREIDNRLVEFGQMLSLQEKTIDHYLADQKKTLEQVRSDMRPAAEKTVKIGLVLRQFAKEQNITVSDEAVEAEASKQLQYYKTVAQAEQQLDADHLREHLIAQLRNRKTLERLAELATPAV